MIQQYDSLRGLNRQVFNLYHTASPPSNCFASKLKDKVHRKINKIGRNSSDGWVISILRPSESIEPQSITSSPKVSPIKEKAEIFIIISAQDRHRKWTKGRIMFGRIWTNNTLLREAPEDTAHST